MALQKQNITIAMSSMDESIDDRVLPTERLLSVKNGQYDKRGAIKKRNGFSALGNAISGGGSLDSAKTLFSTEDELCVVGNTRLHAFNEARSVWYDRGAISPATGEVRDIFRDVNNYELSDLARGQQITSVDDYVIHASEQKYVRDASLVVGNREHIAIAAEITTVDNQQVIPPTEINNTNDESFAPHAPRCLATGTKLCVLHASGTGAGPILGGPNDLFLHEWDAATPTVGFSTGIPLTINPSDLWFFQQNLRTYDAIGIHEGGNEGDYLVAYVSQATPTPQRLVVARRDSAHVLQANTFLHPVDTHKYTRVALANSTASADVFYVLAVVEAGDATPARVEAWALQKSNCTVIWGPTTVRLLGATESVFDLGCVESGARLVCTWDMNDGDAGVTRSTENMSIDAATGNIATTDGIWKIYNARLRTRPFVVNGRTYAWLCSTISYANGDSFPGGTELFECEWLADLMTNDANPVCEYNFTASRRMHVFCGIHNIGVAPCTTTVQHSAVSMGSTNNVVDFGSGVHRNMTTTRSYFQPLGERRHAATRVSLDFEEAPLTAIVNRGAAVIGGAAWFWYTGNWAEELSFAYPPIVFEGLDGAPPAQQPEVINAGQSSRR